MAETSIGSGLDNATFVVVRNQYNQHSIWPGSEAIPRGWMACPFRGPRQECLTYVDHAWRDLRLQTSSDDEAVLSGVID